ncbi:MAG: hypothetical protein VW576_02605, partial [Opitutae bacterium]
DFIRMQVRDEVIEILPDLSGLSDYVDKSSFFTYGERVQVIKELIQFNRSKTLNKILQFDFSY